MDETPEVPRDEAGRFASPQGEGAPDAPAPASQEVPSVDTGGWEPERAVDFLRRADIKPEDDPYSVSRGFRNWRPLESQDPNKAAIELARYLEARPEVAEQVQRFVAPQEQEVDDWGAEPSYEPDTPQFDPQQLTGYIDQQVNERMQALERQQQEAQMNQQLAYQVSAQAPPSASEQYKELLFSTAYQLRTSDAPYIQANTDPSVYAERAKQFLDQAFGSSQQQAADPVTMAQAIAGQPATPPATGATPGPDQEPSSLAEARAILEARRQGIG